MQRRRYGCFLQCDHKTFLSNPADVREVSNVSADATEMMQPEAKHFASVRKAFIKILIGASLPGHGRARRQYQRESEGLTASPISTIVNGLATWTRV